MRTSRFAFALLLALPAVPAAAQVVAWSKSLYAPAGGAAYLSDGHLVTRTMAADASGNLVATGTAAAAGGGSNWITAKLDAASGAVTWQQAFGGSSGARNAALAVALDGAGNAYVVGYVATTAANYDVQVVKYAAADGAVLWQKTFDAGSSDYGYAVVVDRSGNAIVGAESLNAAGNNDMKILKFAAGDGTLAWQQTIDAGRDDFVSDLAVDGSGNVLGAGVSVNASGNTDMRIFKLAAADGSIAWNQAIDGGAADEAFAIAVDASGNAFVAGYTTAGGAANATIAKLAAADGSVSWQKTVANGVGQGVAVDGSGNAVMLAQVAGPGGHDYRTVKYSAAGAVAWDKTYDSGGDDYAYQLALDGAGNAIVAGSSALNGNYDWRALQYASADGSVSWQSHYNGTNNSADENYGLAIANGAVYLGGTSTEQGAAMGLRVAKLVAGSGVAPSGKKSPADFDGDRRADIAWTAGDGSMRLWLMNGATVVDTALELGGGTGWKVVGTGDLDGDGKADIVWQGPGGAIAAWLMNGLAVRSTAQIYAGGGGWTVSHVADLDGDGKADLVWKNTNGAIGVWLMNGTSVTSTAQILDPGVPWSVVVTGDLNGDGKADLVMQYTDGTTIAWYMSGTRVIDSVKLLDPNTGWSAAAAGDLDGDGMADLVWTHTSGAVGVWMMNGKAPKSTAQILGGGTGWAPRKALDFDGDGKADLLWEHPAGSVGIWLMNGATATSTATLVGSGNVWSVK